jgi:hypothetical protein
MILTLRIFIAAGLLMLAVFSVLAIAVALAPAWPVWLVSGLALWVWCWRRSRLSFFVKH